MVDLSSPKPTVLIIEDEAIVAEDLSCKIKALGYDVVGVFSTGEQAINAAQQSCIDLVLLDIRLGQNIDGIETAKKLQQVCDSAIVFTTAHSDPETLKNANATDPFGYILKPFGERDLAVQLAIALHKYRADRALRTAENQLRQREAELDIIVNRTPFLLTRCTRDLRYQFVSRAYADLLGESPAHIVGKPIVDIMGSAGFQTILPHITRVLNGESVNYQTEVEFKNIGKRWLDVQYTPEIDVHGNVVGWIASILDMTERKKAEDRLRESERRFRDMADTAPVLIWLSDTTKLCTWVNRPWLSFTGRTMEQELGNGWADSIHTEDVNGCLNIYTSAFDQRLPFTLEYRLRRHDGQYRWILDHGIPRYAESGDFLGYVGSCSDVTERKEIEEAVASVALFPSENPSPILRVNSDGALLYRNPASEQLIREFCLEVGEPVPEALRNLVQESLLSGRSQNVEHNTGSCQYLISVTPILKENYANLYWTDITERNLAERKLQNKEALLEEEARTLHRLNELSSRLWSKRTLADGLEEMIEAIIELLGAVKGNIQTIDDRGMLVIAAQKGFDQEFLEFFREVSTEANSTCGRALRSGRRIIIEDVDSDELFAPMRDMAQRVGYRAVQSTPLLGHNGEPLGMLSTHWSTPHRPTDQALRRLDLYARQIVDFIERLKTDEALRVSEARLIQNHQALRDSEDRLRMAMTAGRLGSWDWNIKTGQIVWDETRKAMFGIPEHVAMSYELFLQHVHAEDRARVHKTLLQALEEKGKYEVEMRTVLSDGSVRWLQSRGAVTCDADGQRLRLSGVAHDITERKTMETRLQEWNEELERRVTKRTQELLESEQRLTIAQQAAGIGTFDWNLQTGINIWTPELEALYGLQPGQFAATCPSWESLIHPDDRAHAVALVEASRQTGAAAKGEWRVVWPDGSVHWIAGRWRLLKDESGNPVRMTGINIDITERKLNEVALGNSAQQLRRLTTELNLAEQRERKRLAIDMHDHLQQLLVTCRLKLKLAQGKRLGDGHHEWVRLTDEMDELLTGALNYTRTLVAELSPPVLSEQGLGPALQWLADYMKRYGLVVSVSVPERRVRGLPEDQSVLLFQSVRELLFNASKHAGTHEAWVTLEQKEAGLRIEVRDNGVGFVASPLSAPSEDSSKFGLFSIRERMSALGGSLHITSSPEVGTRAVLLLPLTKTMEPPIPLSPATAMSVSKAYHPKELEGVVQVLLVDDHAMVRQGLRAILESYPDVHVIGEAVNGREALEAVRVLRPHVVIMDVNMPVMDGIEATAYIKLDCPDTIVVGLSVNDGQDNREAMMKAGAVDLLTKEAAVEQLHESMVRALNG